MERVLVTFMLDNHETVLWCEKFEEIPRCLYIKFENKLWSGDLWGTREEKGGWDDKMGGEKENVYVESVEREVSGCGDVERVRIRRVEGDGEWKSSEARKRIEEILLRGRTEGTEGIQLWICVCRGAQYVWNTGQFYHNKHNIDSTHDVFWCRDLHAVG